MTRAVNVPVDGDLVVVVSPGADGWKYLVSIRYDGRVVTEYGSDFAPWGPGGITILRNIVTTRLDAYESRDRVQRLLEDAVAARSAELDALDAD